MKRPLALIGLTLMIVLAVCFYTKAVVAKWLLILAAVGLMVSLAVPALRKNKDFSVFFSVVIAAVLIFNSFMNFHVIPIQQKYTSESSAVSGTVCEEAVYDRGAYFYRIKADTVNGEKANVKIILRLPEYINCQVGDRVDFKGAVSPTGYGGYISDGFYLITSIYYTDTPKVTPAQTKPVGYYAVAIRDMLRSNLYLELDYDNASLATAILLGDDSGFEEDVYDNLRVAGLTHIAVVSGLHLSIITMLFSKLFTGVIKNRYVNAVLTVLMVFIFLSITGFGKSSIRAAIMLFVVIASGLFNREGDSINALGLAAILLCTVNPCVVGDVGVLLSFSATFGIVAYSKKLENLLTCRLKPIEESRVKLLNKAARYIAALFACSFTAALATLPVMVIFFGRVSLVQIIANLCVLPFMQYFMIGAFLAAVLHSIPYISVLARFFAFAADIIGSYILKVAQLLASVPFATVRADYTFVVVWVFASILLLVCAHVFRRKVKNINLICVTLSVLIFAIGSISHAFAYKDTVTVDLTASDKGCGVVFDSNEGNITLVSSGDTYVSDKVTEVLDTTYSQRQLMVVASHNNSASESAQRILREFDYKEILMYDTDDSSEHAQGLSDGKGKVSLMYGDTVVDLWSKGELYIAERNDAVYILFSYGTASVLVLPYKGDVSAIPEDMLSCDILIASEIIDNMQLISASTVYFCCDADEAAEYENELNEIFADVRFVTSTDNFNIAG